MTSTNNQAAGEYITITPSPEMRAAVLAAAGLDDLTSPEGTDLYGTRAISQNGQPVHDRCGQPLRWSAAYDEPHWVHTSAAAVVACPPVRGAL